MCAARCGVDAEALRLVLCAQEALDGSGLSEDSLRGAQAAVDCLRQDATNAVSAEEAQRRLLQSFLALGLLQDLEARRSSQIAPRRNDVCHCVVPGLWLGGCTALNDNGEELRKRKVTHVVSIVSADARRLPDFVRKHLHLRVDDREEAGADLAAHFPTICRFLDAARAEPDGVAYVHCGAGISRAPTSVASYLVWKLQVPPASALRMIKNVRPQIRPNVGFVTQLKLWHQEMHSRMRLGLPTQ